MVLAQVEPVEREVPRALYRETVAQSAADPLQCLALMNPNDRRTLSELLPRLMEHHRLLGQAIHSVAHTLGTERPALPFTPRAA